MLVSTPQAKRTVIDYDIIFVSGLVVEPITIDPLAGDTITFEDHAILVHLHPKSSINDPDITLPGTDFTIFTKNLALVKKMEREILDLTPDQKFEWQKTIQELNKTVQ